MTVKRENLVELQSKLYQKCKVHMLPTDKKTNIYLHPAGRTEGYLYEGKLNGFIKGSYQHLYFTSDEEIKEGDWYLYKDEIHQCQVGHTVTKYPKIIATTDTSLNICDGIKRIGESCTKNNNCIYPMCQLPQPSQDFINVFIEEYNNGNIITNVLVEYVDLNPYSEMNNEPMNFPDIQLKIDKNNTITIKKVKDSFTRADIIHAFTYGYGMRRDGMTHGDALIKYKKRENL